MTLRIFPNFVLGGFLRVSFVIWMVLLKERERERDKICPVSTPFSF